MADDNKGRVILKITESGIEEVAVCADTPEQKKAGFELLSIVLREIANLDEALKMIASVDNQPTRKAERPELTSTIRRVRQAAMEIALESHANDEELARRHTIPRGLSVRQDQKRVGTWLRLWTNILHGESGRRLVRD